MLRKILSLSGTVELTKTEKRSIQGGLACVGGKCPKPGNYCCPMGQDSICRLNGLACPEQ
ncbi:hypothetical protein [Flavobacterium branchiicola]|uniref:Bacteriocin-like protein n=1 Tax=Flavobacterium branchiicola TaxID=1114875 RepID=A0ABV9PMQ1_9FLAO|nr:hypothetical protein [Flavobacterium branchiicola]MBS7256319.1 hypothetical protein [Flavobacterium branchiicola]